MVLGILRGFSRLVFARVDTLRLCGRWKEDLSERGDDGHSFVVSKFVVSCVLPCAGSLRIDISLGTIAPRLRPRYADHNTVRNVDERLKRRVLLLN